MEGMCQRRAWIGWLVGALVATGCSEIVPFESGNGTEGDNQPPVLESIDPKTGTENQAVDFVVEVADVDGDTVAISMTDGPTSADFDTQTNTFSWTPAYSTVDCATGELKVTVSFSADDGKGGTDTLEVTIKVQNDEDHDGTPDATDSDIDEDGLANDEELETDVCVGDTDGDQIGDMEDNCPLIENPTQTNTDGQDDGGDACDDDDDDDGTPDLTDLCPTLVDDGTDTDGDGEGDACDPDDDGDGTNDESDKCPLIKDDGTDTDSDGDGDACDDDDDDDTILDDDDNCPKDANEPQTDTDEDGKGDFCDDDDDNDEVPDGEDNCPTVKNTDQQDLDKDDIGDACDPCLDDTENEDPDGDLKCSKVDNCPNVPNKDQENTDGDELGDACDPDDDNDGIDDDDDNCQFIENPDQANCEDDEQGDVCDEDDDNDGVDDDDDNCQCQWNPDQLDTDTDALGDACDPDDDNDEELDEDDNCPLAPNPEQLDFDKDGDGDDCDPDDDDDEVDDAKDNCPFAPNTEQTDTDGDDEGDECDEDDDNDSVLDNVDNCPLTKNAGQKDLDNDALGDACDPDDDGDGVNDGDDNCPMVKNPATGDAQLDVDGDGLGAACDDTIHIPAAAYFGSNTTNADGDARAGTVAVVLKGANACSGVCADAGLFVLEDAGYATIVDGGWADVTPSGVVYQPFCGQDGVALVRAELSNATLAFDRVSSGELDQLLDPTGVPVLNDGPDGVTLAELKVDKNSSKIYAVTASGPPIFKKSAGSFQDINGVAAVKGGDGVLYYHAKSTVGQYDLAVFKSGPATDPIKQHHELRFLDLEPGTGFPVYCHRAEPESPAVVQRFEGGSKGVQISVTGATCLDLQFTIDPAGVWWLDYADAGGRSVLRWVPGAPFQYIAAGKGEVKIHPAGTQTYIRFKEGDTVNVFHHNASGATKQVVTNVTMVALKESASTAGGLGLVYRQSPSASPIRATLIDEGLVASAEIAKNVSPIPSTPQNAWMSPQNILWTHLLEQQAGPPKTRVYHVELVSGLPAKLQVAFAYATSGKAKMSFHGSIGLLGVDGLESAGLYKVTGTKASLIADATGPHTVLAESGGMAFVAYPVAGSKYALARVDPSKALAEELSDELVGPPQYTTIQQSTQRFWFTWETALGSTYAYLEDGEMTPWQTDQATIFAVDWTPDNDPEPWGVRMRKSFGDPWVWCELPPSVSCWTMDTVESLAWSKVDPSGRVHAVYFQESEAILWRNLGTAD